GNHWLLRGADCEIARFQDSEDASPYPGDCEWCEPVNELTLVDVIGEPLEKADAAFVLENTGFVIGRAPPLGHLNPLLTFLDVYPARATSTDLLAPVHAFEKTVQHGQKALDFAVSSGGEGVPLTLRH